MTQRDQSTSPVPSNMQRVVLRWRHDNQAVESEEFLPAAAELAPGDGFALQCRDPEAIGFLPSTFLQVQVYARLYQDVDVLGELPWTSDE